MLIADQKIDRLIKSRNNETAEPKFELVELHSLDTGAVSIAADRMPSAQTGRYHRALSVGGWRQLKTQTDATWLIRTSLTNWSDRFDCERTSIETRQLHDERWLGSDRQLPIADHIHILFTCSTRADLCSQPLQSVGLEWPGGTTVDEAMIVDWLRTR